MERRHAQEKRGKQGTWVWTGLLQKGIWKMYAEPEEENPVICRKYVFLWITWSDVHG